MPHTQTYIQHSQHSYRNTQPGSSWSCVVLQEAASGREQPWGKQAGCTLKSQRGKFQKDSTLQRLGRPKESFRSFWILRDFTVYSWGCASYFFILAHVSLLLGSLNYPMDPTEETGENPPATQLPRGLLLSHAAGTCRYAMMTFIVPIDIAHNQICCCKTCVCKFLRQSPAPGYQRFQHAQAKKNGTGRDVLVLEKWLPAKTHCGTLKVSTSEPLQVVSVVKSHWRRRHFETVRWLLDCFQTSFLKEALSMN